MNFNKRSFVVLVFATALAAGSASATCSDATVTGVWGYIVGAAVGQFTADGKGNITKGSQTVSNNGTIVTQTFTGTYSVSANCTGSLTSNVKGGGSASLNFVLDDTNKGAQIILDESGKVASGFGLALGTVTCGLSGKKETFAADIFGKISGSEIVAYVAQVILDGKGNVSGSGTFDVNGTIDTTTITGTYTLSANCTGTAKITPSGGNPLNFNFVVVNGGKEILLIETDTGTVVGGYMQQ